MGFFPTLCIYRQKQGGGTGVEGGPTTEWGLLPLHASGSHTGGAMHAQTHTHTHTLKCTRGSPGVHSFHREGEVKVGGWDRGRQKGWGGQGEGTETRAPHHHKPSGRSILKAALSLHGRTGWGGRGQGGSICGGQWSCWSAQGAPRYPVIHDNQREREREGRGKVREMERERTWKSSAAVRERSVGAESEEQSTQWFSFFPSLSALYCPQTCPSFLYWK